MERVQGKDLYSSAQAKCNGAVGICTYVGSYEHTLGHGDGKCTKLDLTPTYQSFKSLCATAGKHCVPRKQPRNAMPKGSSKTHLIPPKFKDIGVMSQK